MKEDTLKLPRNHDFRESPGKTSLKFSLRMNPTPWQDFLGRAPDNLTTESSSS